MSEMWPPRTPQVCACGCGEMVLTAGSKYRGNHFWRNRTLRDRIARSLRAKTATRNAEMVELNKQGVGIRQIAVRYGISKQRVSQIINDPANVGK